MSMYKFCVGFHSFLNIFLGLKPLGFQLAPEGRVAIDVGIYIHTTEREFIPNPRHIYIKRINLLEVGCG